MKFLKKMYKERDEDTCSLSVTPMIDIVFLLVIFFICTLDFKIPDHRIDSNLNRGGPTIDHKQEIKEIPEFRISVEPDTQGTGTVFRIGRDLRVSAEDLPAAVKQAYSAFETLHAGSEEKIMTVIQGHGEVHFQYVVAALDACLGAKISNINFAPYSKYI